MIRSRIPLLLPDAIEAIWHNVADRALLNSLHEPDPRYQYAMLKTAATNRGLAASSQARRARVST